MRAFRCLLLLLAVAAPVAAAEPEDPRFGTARAAIEQHVVAGGVPSIAVAVAEHGRIVWQQGFGWADRERRIPATADTAYALASITKTITAAGLMILVERGSLDLDRPVNQYLGAAKLVARVGNAADATVRRVANHTSGLPLHYQFFYDDEGTAPPPMDQTIRRYGNIVTIPGEVHRYSNLGYGILGEVIARVSGKSYAAFTQDSVFAPLGMTHSFVGRPSNPAIPTAIAYAPDGSVVPRYGFDHDGASAVFASAADLLRFGMSCLGDPVAGRQQILSDAARGEMFRPTAETRVAGMQRAVGWSVRNTGGQTAYAHNGGMAGAATSLLLLPAQDAVIVVLSNGSAPAAVREVLDRITAALLPPTEQRSVFAAETNLRGNWRGSIRAAHGAVPLAIEIGDSVIVRVAGTTQVVAGARIDEDGMLAIDGVRGDLGTADAARYPYSLQLLLKPRGDRLNGAVTAISAPLPGRLGNALSYWAELRR